MEQAGLSSFLAPPSSLLEIVENVKHAKLEYLI